MICRGRVMRAWLAGLALAFPVAESIAQQGEWPFYGRDPGGARFAPLTQVTRDNVARLEIAWIFHTGEAGVRIERGGPPSLEVTPLMVDGVLYLSTPIGRVIALDPGTGRERWRFDAGVDVHKGYGDFTSRGVSAWLDPLAPSGAPCRRRIFVATIDARLLALDAATGTPCADFGRGGTIDLRPGLRVAPFEFQAYQVTSPPAVAGDLVITGSAIADNSRIAPASGEVRAFDARTGALRWTWDPIPQDTTDPAHSTWEAGSARRTGGANVWSVIAVDTDRDLVFLPTSSPAPDYYGVFRPGANRYANSVVALRASSGRVVWSFQTVHHDLWDYDNAPPPALADVPRGGGTVPAVLQATKTGQLFILHRETGEPLFPVEERPVPSSTIPGERAWPTQPFTSVTPPLSPHGLDPAEIWGATEEDRRACEGMIAPLRNDGVYTPPDTGGTLARPSNIGGAHWGGLAVDRDRGLAIVPVNRIASMVQLLPRAEYDAATAREEIRRFGYEYNGMQGTPYVMRRRFLLGPGGLSCSAPPFGALVAVSLSDGAIRWQVPLGTLRLPDGTLGPPEWGSPNLGGPIATATGLVFIAATLDRSIRAYDTDTGRELWRADLPAGGKATPMTYLHRGRQYLVIAAGGGGRFGDGDALVAFALPQERR